MLLDAMYAAPEQEGGWDHFLHLLGGELHSGATALMSYDFRNEASHLNHVVRIAPDTLRAYEQYYAGVNPWLRPENEGRFVAGRAQVSEEIVSLKDVKLTEFYQDFGRRAEIVHTMGLVMSKPGSRVMPVLSTNRGERLGMFDSGAVRLMEQLASHVHRVVDWQSRNVRYRSLRHLFEVLPDATWELDRNGKVMESNEQARLLEVAEKVVRLRQGGLQFAGKAGFEALSERLSRSWEGTVVNEGFLAARPLKSGWLVIYKQAGVAREERLQAIGKALGCTAAELRLLAALLEGGGLREAAEKLGLSQNTVKSQIASLFQKTGTRRQADLVRAVGAWLG
jgi:DNA-binding CsgD family transcriptional regulator